MRSIPFGQFWGDVAAKPRCIVGLRRLRYFLAEKEGGIPLVATPVVCWARDMADDPAPLLDLSCASYMLADALSY